MTTLPSSFSSASGVVQSGRGLLRRSCAWLALCAASLACTGDGGTDEPQELCSSENDIEDIDDGAGAPQTADDAQLSY